MSFSLQNKFEQDMTKCLLPCSFMKSAKIFKVPAEQESSDKVKRLCPDSNSVDTLVKYNLKAKREIAQFQKLNRERKMKDKQVNDMLLQLHGLVSDLCKDRESYKHQIEVLTPFKDENVQLKEELLHLKHVQKIMFDRMKLLEDEKDRLSML